MNKIFGNFTLQGALKFPLDCETLESLQQLSSFAEALGARISTNAFIVSGCEQIEDETTRGEGLIFVHTSQHPEGEVLPFVGGSTASGFFHLVSTPVAVSQQGYNYAEAYTKRSLAPGQGDAGDEAFAWEDTEELMTLQQLATEIDNLSASLAALNGEPAGVIKMWAGQTAPDGYAFCDGSRLLRSEYPSLFEAIGTAFNQQGDGNDYFRLPDLHGRFIVGLDGGDDDYDTLGKTGGEKTHILTTDQMPEHRHVYVADMYADGKSWYISSDTGAGITESGRNYTPNAISGSIPQNSAGEGEGTGSKAFATGKSGFGTPHENRPPYFVLAYIIKLI